MKIEKTTLNQIYAEYSRFKDSMYAGKTKEERDVLGQFFTPPELSLRMLEKFEELSGNLIDPTCGAGNLLVVAFWLKYQQYGGKPGISNEERQEYLQKSFDTIYGIEIDPIMLKVFHDRLLAFQNYLNKTIRKRDPNFNITINLKNFQLGDVFKADINSEEFWKKDPFDTSYL